MDRMEHKTSDEPTASERFPESLLGGYLRFLRSPTLTDPPAAMPKSKARNHVLRLYSLHLLLIIVVGAIISSFGLQDSNLTVDAFSNMSVRQLVVAVVFVAPLLEEMIFRLPLKGTVSNLALTASAIAFMVLMFSGISQPQLIVVGFVLLVLNLYLKLERATHQVWPRFYERYPGLIFYFFALFFGAVHITNYSPEAWPLLPLLVLPQAIAGLWLGFVRVRYGFWWSVLAHGFHNGCLLLPLALFKLFGSEELQALDIDAAEIESFPPLDLLLLFGVGLFFAAGIWLCIANSWKMVREWKRE